MLYRKLSVKLTNSGVDAIKMNAVFGLILEELSPEQEGVPSMVVAMKRFLK